MFNVHKSHLWTRDKPHALWERGYQVRVSVGVWDGIVGNNFVGPNLLADRLTAEQYRNFMETLLPVLLEGVPLAVRQSTTVVQRTGEMSSSDYTRQIQEGSFAVPGTYSEFSSWGNLKENVYAVRLRTISNISLQDFKQLRQRSIPIC
jgi:hypothetical protein